MPASSFCGFCLEPETSAVVEEAEEGIHMRQEGLEVS